MDADDASGWATQSATVLDLSAVRVSWSDPDPTSGEIEIEKLEVRSELWPQWLDIADKSVAASLAARERNPGPGEGREPVDALTAEFQPAMVAVCASAFAIEAFTSSLVDIESAVKPPAPENGDRQTQWSFIAETWKRAFRIAPSRWNEMRKELRSLFGLRNRAVHVDAGFVEVIPHPIFGVNMDPMFTHFRYETARDATQSALSLIAEISGSPRERYPAVVSWAALQATRFQGPGDPADGDQPGDGN